MASLLGSLLDISDHDRYEYQNSLDDGRESELERHRYSNSKTLSSDPNHISQAVREATINEIFDRIILLWDNGLLSDRNYGLVSMAIYEMLNNITNWNPAKSHRFTEWTRGNIPNKQGEYKFLDDNKIWEVLLCLRSKNIAEFQVSTNQMTLNFDLVDIEEN